MGLSLMETWKAQINLPLHNSAVISCCETTAVCKTHTHTNFPVLILSPQIVRRFLLTKDLQDAVGCRFKPAPIKIDLLTSHQIKQPVSPELMNFCFALVNRSTLKEAGCSQVLFNWRKYLFNVTFTLIAFKHIKLECDLAQH